MLPARRLFSCEYTGIPVGNFSSKRFALWYDKSHKSGLSEMRVSQNNRKGKNAEQMLHDANDAKELSDDWDRAKDLCYDYNQLRPSKELFAL